MLIQSIRATSRTCSPWYSSDLPEVRKHRVDQLECLIDFFTNFGAGQDDLSADEDQEHNLWFHHTVDETREQFRFIGTEVVMAAGQTFQTDRKLDIARTHNVLDFEVGELGVESKFLDDTGILP